MIRHAPATGMAPRYGSTTATAGSCPGPGSDCNCRCLHAGAAGHRRVPRLRDAAAVVIVAAPCGVGSGTGGPGVADKGRPWNLDVGRSAICCLPDPSDPDALNHPPRPTPHRRGSRSASRVSGTSMRSASSSEEVSLWASWLDWCCGIATPRAEEGGSVRSSSMSSSSGVGPVRTPRHTGSRTHRSGGCLLRRGVRHPRRQHALPGVPEAETGRPPTQATPRRRRGSTGGRNGRRSGRAEPPGGLKLGAGGRPDHHRSPTGARPGTAMEPLGGPWAGV